ncbi:hypothetical protein [Bacillus sp. AK128]
MEKNARGYVQETYSALTTARENLQNALQTVERDSNRNEIQDSLQAVEEAIQQCSKTVSRLEEV